VCVRVSVPVPVPVPVSVSVFVSVTVSSVSMSAYLVHAVASVSRIDKTIGLFCKRAL